MPCYIAKISDIDIDLFRSEYLEKLMGKELVATDNRPIEEQMSAVGMYDTIHDCPTNAAVVLFGKHPRRFIPGLYVQYVRFKGEDVTGEVENELQLDGNKPAQFDVSLLTAFRVTVEEVTSDVVKNVAKALGRQSHHTTGHRSIDKTWESGSRRKAE